MKRFFLFLLLLGGATVVLANPLSIAYKRKALKDLAKSSADTDSQNTIRYVSEMLAAMNEQDIEQTYDFIFNYALPAKKNNQVLTLPGEVKHRMEIIRGKWNLFDFSYFKLF